MKRLSQRPLMVKRPWCRALDCDRVGPRVPATARQRPIPCNEASGGLRLMASPHPRQLITLPSERDTKRSGIARQSQSQSQSQHTPVTTRSPRNWAAYRAAHLKNCCTQHTETSVVHANLRKRQSKTNDDHVRARLRHDATYKRRALGVHRLGPE